MSLETKPTNRAWRLAPDGALNLDTVATPNVQRGTVVIRMQSVPLLSYLRDYIAGRLPFAYPPAPFTVGTNGIGTVESTGDDVYHLASGMRVFISPHLVADETVDEPAQILMGLTGLADDHGM